MKINLLLILLLAGEEMMAQCPDITVSLTGKHCAGDTLVVQSSGLLSQIQWYNGTQLVKTVASSVTTSPVTVVAGGNGYGSGENQLSNPLQICLDNKGYLYVADQSSWRIEKFPPGSTSATFAVEFIPPNSAGSGNPQFYSGVYVDGQGNVYTENVPDVRKWTPDGKSSKTIATVTHTGNDPNLFAAGQIFVDKALNVYVVEPGNNRVQRWAPGASSGVTVAGGNGAGPAANQLDTPGGIYVDSVGNLYIADQNNNRIQKWAPDAATGVTVAGGKGAGWGGGQLDHPLCVCVDGAGNMFIGDGSMDSRVVEWTPGAAGGVIVAGGNGFGSGLDQIVGAVSVFLDHTGYLYISDQGNGRVLKTLPAVIHTIDTTLITDAPGTYTAVVTSEEGCTLTTNDVVIQPATHSDMSISPSANPICAGDSTTFTDVSAGGSPGFSYQWVVNGKPVDGDGTLFIDRQPSDGDLVTCQAKDESVCATATSNSVALTVHPSPVIPPGQEFSFNYGASVTLNPVVTGEVASYSWSPATGLSDTTLRDPLASPSGSTQYILKAVSPDGCTASSLIKVDVFTQLRMPNAFTPNGDGKNDVFYVLGGQPGLVIREFAVFDRWGQRVFQVHDAVAGDPSFGWNGRKQGNPVPPGTYVYIIVMQLPGGKQAVARGTVEVVR